MIKKSLWNKFKELNAQKACKKRSAHLFLYPCSLVIQNVFISKAFGNNW